MSGGVFVPGGTEGAPPLEIRLRLARAAFVLSVDLVLPGSGISVVFGPSGCGKTTLLRCVAGLERATQARVVVDGTCWQDESLGLFVPTHRRALGYVFQEASLFEHLDVQGNLRFGMRRAHDAQAEAGLASAIALLGIGHLMARRPHELSGGERQRVAIARALATQPRVLLLDEPLAALDHARRQDILPWLERLRDELHIPMLYVTHAADELARLADHLVVLDNGAVTTSAPAAQALSGLDVPVVVGEDAGALLQGVVAERDAQWHLLRVDFDGGSLWLRDSGATLGQRVRLRVLARDVSLATEEPHHSSIQNHLRCVVEAVHPDSHPAQVMVRVRCGSSALLARVTRRALHTLALAPGSVVWAQVKSVALVS